MSRFTMAYKSIFAVIVVFVLFAFTEKYVVTPEKNSKKELASFKSTIDTKVDVVYNSLQTNSFELPNFECFSEALKGFYSLKEKGLIKNDVLTLIDFSVSSNLKRLWIIDLTNNMVLLQTLVAHGRNTGDEFATDFSNTPESFKSSLGFYLTGEVYNGKHGLSLKLDGLDKGLNDNARNRAVVIHGANYVSESFIRDHKRLGRSQGCPAVPVELASDIISMIKGQSCIFIYHSSMDISRPYKSVS